MGKILEYIYERFISDMNNQGVFARVCPNKEVRRDSKEIQLSSRASFDSLISQINISFRNEGLSENEMDFMKIVEYNYRLEHRGRLDMFYQETGKAIKMVLPSEESIRIHPPTSFEEICETFRPLQRADVWAKKYGIHHPFYSDGLYFIFLP